MNQPEKLKPSAEGPDGPSAISARDVSKYFDSTVALDSVSLDIRRGELLSLLGPSGSGKTTLLNIFAGFLRPSRGQVTFEGEDVTLLPPNKRDIGFVFQNYALFPHMTVGDNVAYSLKVRGVGRDEIAERVAWSLENVQLGGPEGRRVDQLSGGQQQRVALARAIIFEPKIILMDEPLSALDKQLREHMQIELRRLHERIGATTVYVTHDQREALTLSDRIAVLDHGRTMQLGTPRDLYEHPENRFVAEFVGETSLLPVKRGGPNEVVLAGQTLRTDRPVPEGKDLHLVVRTEKILLAGPDRREDHNHISGRVSEVVYQGESVRIFVELGDGSTVSLRRLCHDDGSGPTPEPGAGIDLALPPENTVVVAD